MYIMIILTRFGVRLELACNSSAAVPAAMGVAIEVPFRYICLRVGSVLTPASSSGCCVTIRLSTASASTILLPGATMSGLTRLS